MHVSLTPGRRSKVQLTRLGCPSRYAGTKSLGEGLKERGETILTIQSGVDGVNVIFTAFPMLVSVIDEWSTVFAVSRLRYDSDQSSLNFTFWIAAKKTNEDED